MDKNTYTRCEEMAKVMKALGHPTRTFIALELAEGPRCVCELTEMIGADISTVSKHLNIMKNVGLVNSTKKGLQIYYSLASPCVLSFFSCVENVVKKQIDNKSNVF
jgi:ArsR family transcriptional regulator